MDAYLNKEQLYLQVLENLQDGVYFVDQNRKITFWNKCAERITGYSAAEVFSRNSPTVYDDKLIESLSEKAMYDNLTGLPNRAYLESFLSFKLDEFAKFRRRFAVLLCDIDDFRIFNNDYGHDTGDLILRNIARSIQRTTRKEDLFARWGGEEMMGVYSIENTVEAAAIAEKLRHLVNGTEVITPRGNLKVTVSIGITIVRENDTIGDLFKRADELMYESKKHGKNRVTSDATHFLE